MQNHIEQFEVPFVNGENMIEAIGIAGNKAVRDLLKVDFRMIPVDLKSETNTFSELNVMLGSQRFFEDKISSAIWIPEKPYSLGSWGYIGGKN